MHKIHGEEMKMDAMPRMMPSLYLTDKDYPEIKDWKVGEKYLLVMQVEMKSMEKNDMGEGERTSGRFEIQQIGSMDDMTDKEMEKLIAKAKSS